MTDEELRAMLADATPGPWDWDTRGFVGPVSTEDDQSFGMICDEVAECTYSGGGKKANARLIAAAPDLAAEVLRLRARVAQLEAAHGKDLGNDGLN